VDYYSIFKRLLDIIFSTTAVLVFSPLFYLAIIFIKIDSTGPVFFRQKRIGRHFAPFYLIKFRSMTVLRNPEQGEFDPGDKHRITRAGSFLRKTKLDELPELFNVLNGDMSIVGPRPEVEKYVKVYHEDFKEILKIRPGLSDYASVKYRDEETILANQSDPESYYRQVILPDKINLAKRYIKDISFKTDMQIIGETLKCIVRGKR